MRTVIGIDPGPRESAIVQWDGRQVVRALDLPNMEVPDYLEATPYADELAIEWVQSYGMAVGKEVFETVFWIGWMSHGFSEVRLIPRPDVKLHLYNSARAKDANIAIAIQDRFGGKGTKKNPGPLWGIAKHRWAALAVAITAFDVNSTAHEKSIQSLSMLSSE